MPERNSGCQKCEYLVFKHGTLCGWDVYNRLHPIRGTITIFGDCWERNKNLDCKDFKVKPTLGEKIHRFFSRITRKS